MFARWSVFGPFCINVLPFLRLRRLCHFHLHLPIFLYRGPVRLTNSDFIIAMGLARFPPVYRHRPLQSWAFPYQICQPAELYGSPNAISPVSPIYHTVSSPLQIGARRNPT